ncbi:MAG: efflux RND transporter periplasmic adaptor subunit [Lachnospiraceae bacterium]|jgi:HlyD family secretion protein|nr:efflux RND transporter periplasmic adaptor subunit [Lachnospiraceae bacterium]
MSANRMPKRPKGRKTPEQRRRQGKITTAVIGVLAILAMAAMVMVPKMTQTDTTPMVDTREAEKSDVTAYLEVSGTVKSLRTKTYYSPVNATIKEFSAKNGQIVNVGSMLVSFETDTLEADNKKAELTHLAMVNTNLDTVGKADKAMAEAQTAKGNSQIIQGDIDNYKNYINGLKQSINDRTLQLARQASESAVSMSKEQAKELKTLNKMLEAATQIEKLETENESYQAEIDKLAIEQSQAEFEEDSNTAKTIEAQLKKRQKAVDANEIELEQLENQMGAYSGMEAADIQAMIQEMSTAGELEAVEKDSASTDAQLAQWQMDLENAQSVLADLQSDLAEEKAKVDAGDTMEISNANKKAMENNNNLAELDAMSQEELLEKGRQGIKAEFNGIVTSAALSDGMLATQGLELVSIASNDDVAVEATVSKYDYHKLKEGQKAEITIANNTYQGTVGDINRVAQQNEKGAPIVTCEVVIDNPDDNIFLGVEAKASILVGSEKNVLTVPADAVNTGKDNTFCYVLEDGVIARREITTGISSDTLTEIKSGLKEGDLVIPQLQEGLTEGSPAKSAPAADELGGTP